MIDLVVFLTLLGLGFWVGGSRERKHVKLLESRELARRDFPVLTLSQLPPGWTVSSAGVVTGEVVVAFDYFKVVAAGLRALVGGRLISIESLLDRARREAIQRMIDSARGQGYDAIIRVRIESSSLGNPGQGKPTGGVSMLAYGTGVRRA